MTVTDKSDKEIIEIVEPMIDEVINASNQKDWEVFSKYQTDEEARDPENRKNVERLWKESELFTTLNPMGEILGVLRRDDIAVVCWKQTSNKVPGEYLASYHIKEVNNEIKELGFVII